MRTRRGNLYKLRTFLDSWTLSCKETKAQISLWAQRSVFKNRTDVGETRTIVSEYTRDFVYEDIFKSPLKGRNPCEVGTWKISSWGQGLVTVVRTFLHVRTLWWIQKCYINMFPSPHICLQLSVCLYSWLFARWSSHVCKDQRVCFQLFVGSMFFSGIRDYTVDTHTLQSWWCHHFICGSA